MCAFLNFFFKKTSPQETIDWTFTKFHSSLFTVTEKSGLWSDTGAQAPLVILIKPFSKQQILDSSKLKQFEVDNFKFNENGRKFSKREESTVEKEKLLVTSNFSFSPSAFKRLVLQTSKTRAIWERVKPDLLL